MIGLELLGRPALLVPAGPAGPEGPPEEPVGFPETSTADPADPVAVATRLAALEMGVFEDMTALVEEEIPFLLVSPGIEVAAQDEFFEAEVRIRNSVMELMLKLAEEMDVSYLYITHDLAVARYMCHRIAVMYLGKIVEIAPTETLLADPKHPYTRALLSAVPVPDPTVTRPEVDIRGGISKPVDPEPTCRFPDRCPWADDVCRTNEHPPLERFGEDHYVACYHAN